MRQRSRICHSPDSAVLFLGNLVREGPVGRLLGTVGPSASLGDRPGLLVWVPEQDKHALWFVALKVIPSCWQTPWVQKSLCAGKPPRAVPRTRQCLPVPSLEVEFLLRNRRPMCDRASCGKPSSCGVSWSDASHLNRLSCAHLSTHSRAGGLSRFLFIF